MSGPDDTGTVVLVSPKGGIKTIGEVSDDAGIGDISKDAKEIVTERSQDGQTRVTVWDTTTHRPHYFRVPGEDASIQFAGHNLVVGSKAGTTLRSPSGKILHNYGVKSQFDPTIVVSPNGAYFAHPDKASIDVMRVSDGKVVRSVPVPNVSATCDPMRGWDSSSFVMTCTSNGGVGDDQPYRAGYTARVATKALAPAGAGAVWRTSPVRVNQSFSGGCQSPPGYYTGKKWHELHVSKTDGSAPTVTGGAGSSVYLLQQSCAGTGKQFLQRYDLKSKKFTNLAGTASTGGGLITDAVTVDGS